MPLNISECQVSEMANSDTCPRPTTKAVTVDKAEQKDTYDCPVRPREGPMMLKMVFIRCLCRRAPLRAIAPTAPPLTREGPSFVAAPAVSRAPPPGGAPAVQCTAARLQLAFAVGRQTCPASATKCSWMRPSLSLSESEEDSVGGGRGIRERSSSPGET
jgi:hypothetical protein